MEQKDIIKINYEYYKKNRVELCKKHLNKYLIIKDESVYGVYATMEEAINNAKNIDAGTYIIQKCEKQEDIQVFHTRVRFNEK